jgi:hypothetical protein
MAAPKLNGAEPRQQLEQPRSERFRVSPERLRAILSLLLFTAGELVKIFSETSANTRRILERIDPTHQN